MWLPTSRRPGRRCLVTLLAFAVMAGVACTQAPETATETPAATPAPSPTPVAEPVVSAPEVSVAELLDSLATALETAGTLHFELEMQAGMSFRGIKLEVPFVFVGDFQLPDRFTGIAALDLPLFRVAKKVVGVGGQMYVADADSDDWAVIGSGTPFFASPAPFLALGSADLKQAAVAGVEALGDDLFYRLEATTIAGTFGSSLGEFVVSYWIGVEDGLAGQVMASGVLDLEDDPYLGGAFAGQIPVNIELKFSDFGKQVTIEAPVP